MDLTREVDKILMKNEEYRKTYKLYLEEMHEYLEKFNQIFLKKYPENKNVLLLSAMLKVFLQREINKL
jgi:hypothetical protein